MDALKDVATGERVLNGFRQCGYILDPRSQWAGSYKFGAVIVNV